MPYVCLLEFALLTASAEIAVCAAAATICPRYGIASIALSAVCTAGFCSTACTPVCSADTTVLTYGILLNAPPTVPRRLLPPLRRSEERRVGKECRSRWS